MLAGEHRWEAAIKCADASRARLLCPETEHGFRAHHTATHVVPHTTESLWSGHFFPATESLAEAEVSCNLALAGYYKQSMASLRASLELGLLSVYWNLQDDGHLIIKRWLHSREDTPWTKEIWTSLSTHAGIAHFSEVFGVRERIQDLFGELSNYVHSRGRLYSNDHADPELPLFTFRPSEHIIDLWMDTHRQIVWLILALHLAKYPVATLRMDWGRKFGIDVPAFGGLAEPEVAMAEAYLGEAPFAVLRQIAEADQHTQQILAWIDSLPDMTEEQVELQILDMDKTQIQHGGGYLAWELQQRRMHATLYPDGVPPKVEKRMASLRAWAQDNECYDSPESWMRRLIEGE